LSILGYAKPQQQHNDAEHMRHVARQAENVHGHDFSLLCLLACCVVFPFFFFFSTHNSFAGCCLDVPTKKSQ
jgi:hypothetical protein